MAMPADGGRPLGAMIHVAGINKTISASSTFGDFYRCLSGALCLGSTPPHCPAIDGSFDLCPRSHSPIGSHSPFFTHAAFCPCNQLPYTRLLILDTYVVDALMLHAQASGAGHLQPDCGDGGVRKRDGDGGGAGGRLRGGGGNLDGPWRGCGRGPAQLGPRAQIWAAAGPGRARRAGTRCPPTCPNARHAHLVNLPLSASQSLSFTRSLCPP